MKRMEFAGPRVQRGSWETLKEKQLREKEFGFKLVPRKESEPNQRSHPGSGKPNYAKRQIEEGRS